MAIFGEKTCSPSTWMNLAFQYLNLSVILKKSKHFVISKSITCCLLYQMTVEEKLHFLHQFDMALTSFSAKV